MAWDPPEGFLELPIEELAMLMLRAVVDSEQPTFYFDFFTQRSGGESIYLGTGIGHTEAWLKMASAWDWLYIHGFTATNYVHPPGGGPHGYTPPPGDWRVVTAAGKLAVGDPTALRDLSWANLLSVPLHPLIDEKVRKYFALADYETAVFAAFKAIEVAVRKAGGYSGSRNATSVMRDAFKSDGGDLREPGLEPSEQQGRSELYAGAMSVFKNPGSHREVDYDDPIEAAKAVLFADLLLSMFDHTLEQIERASADDPTMED